LTAESCAPILADFTQSIEKSPQDAAGGALWAFSILDGLVPCFLKGSLAGHPVFFSPAGVVTANEKERKDF